MTLARGALLTAFFIFPASLLRPVGGWLSDRYGARPVTYSVFVVMLLASMILSAPEGSLGFHVGPTAFFILVETLGIGMGLGKASVYKYIPEYFPKDVGAAGGLVGSLGALGGFFLPIGFGYLETATGRPESCFWVMSALMATCLLWLQVVIMDLRRQRSTANRDGSSKRATGQSLYRGNATSDRTNGVRRAGPAALFLYWGAVRSVGASARGGG